MPNSWESFEDRSFSQRSSLDLSTRGRIWGLFTDSVMMKTVPHVWAEFLFYTLWFSRMMIRHAHNQRFLTVKFTPSHNTCLLSRKLVTRHTSNASHIKEECVCKFSHNAPTTTTRIGLSTTRWPSDWPRYSWSPGRNIQEEFKDE